MHMCMWVGGDNTQGQKAHFLSKVLVCVQWPTQGMFCTRAMLPLTVPQRVMVLPASGSLGGFQPPSYGAALVFLLALFLLS